MHDVKMSVRKSVFWIVLVFFVFGISAENKDIVEDCSKHFGINHFGQCQCRPAFRKWKNGEDCTLATATYVGNATIVIKKDQKNEIATTAKPTEEENWFQIQEDIGDCFGKKILTKDLDYLWTTILERSRTDGDNDKNKIWDLKVSVQFDKYNGVEILPERQKDVDCNGKFKMTNVSDSFLHFTNECNDTLIPPYLMCPPNTECFDTKSGYNCTCTDKYEITSEVLIGTEVNVQTCKLKFWTEEKIIIAIATAVAISVLLAFFVVVCIISCKSRRPRRIMAKGGERMGIPVSKTMSETSLQRDFNHHQVDRVDRFVNQYQEPPNRRPLSLKVPDSQQGIPRPYTLDAGRIPRPMHGGVRTQPASNRDPQRRDQDILY